jgi:hypothetical protein
MNRMMVVVEDFGVDLVPGSGYIYICRNEVGCKWF